MAAYIATCWLRRFFIVELGRRKSRLMKIIGYRSRPEKKNLNGTTRSRNRHKDSRLGRIALPPGTVAPQPAAALLLRLAVEKPENARLGLRAGRSSLRPPLRQ